MTALTPEERARIESIRERERKGWRQDDDRGFLLAIIDRLSTPVSPPDGDLLGLCDEVLRLDGEATPGPWQARFLYRVIRPVRMHARRLGLILGNGTAGQDMLDSELAATYRTAAPRLARALRDRLMAPVAAVEYRPGLPSVDAVREHAERAQAWTGKCEYGRWLCMDDEELRVFDLADLDGELIDVVENGCGFNQESLPTEALYRPCLPDGTPCPWPMPAAAPEQILQGEPTP